MEGFDKKDMKEYHKKQIDGHKLTEGYALSTPGYMGLMKYLRAFIPPKGVVLEIGCNTGYECISIQNENRRVKGIDIGREFIEKAKSLGIDARIMDMHNLRFKAGFFDCVYANNTLEHSHTPKKAIAEMFRVVKKGGTVVICIPSDYKNPGYKPVENWDSTLHLWKPNKEEFNKAVVDAGFSSVMVDEIDSGVMFELENRASCNSYLVAVCKK